MLFSVAPNRQGIAQISFHLPYLMH
jgi:hypothetical protein